MMTSIINTNFRSVTQILRIIVPTWLVTLAIITKTLEQELIKIAKTAQSTNRACLKTEVFLENDENMKLY